MLYSTITITILMKVSKNVTFTLEHIRLIDRIMTEERIKNFSKALGLSLDRLMRQVMIINRLSKENSKHSEELVEWKERYERKFKEVDKNG